ncbi:MAG: hypothetical protein Q8O99_04890 [bacterium]|nr:hypothetical protein [bacterium]
MLERATHYFDGEKVRPITEQDKQYLVGQQDERAQQAMRNLCYGYRTFDQFDDKTELDEAERDLTILGVVSMIDPPREEVMGAVEAAYESGIHVFVITGDYALTAEAIAHRI